MRMEMSRLADLQRSFQSVLLEPGGSLSQPWVSDKGHATAEIRLNVYAHAYRSRLKEVLESDYPAVSAAIGCAQFERLAEDYIQQYPSSYFSLRDFGCRFPQFIDEMIQRAPWDSSLGWLCELALFEWRLGMAFDAADSDLVDERYMAKIAADRWPSLRFEFVPSAGTIDFFWNTPQLWKSLTSVEPAPLEAVRSESGRWLIWRQDLVTRFRSLEQDERRMMDRLLEGGTFKDACTLLASSMDEEDVPLRAAGLLKGWINQGLIAAVNSN